MTTSLLEKEIARFLGSPEPEVLCLRGKWGVGKTFSWNKFLSHARDNQKIALDSYSYVSLFGIDSLDQLKYAVFENSVASTDIGIEPSIESFKSNTASVAKRIGRKSLPILRALPSARNYAAALQSLSFLSVRNKIVCFDDLERSGKNLRMGDVLGLVSHLKEHKACKVALVMNDDAIEEANKDDLKRYNEKVIDVSLEFSPTPQECIEIAVTAKGDVHDLLRNAVVALRISNIRIIKKIERLVLRVAPLVQHFHPKVLNQSVQSLTLLGWSHYGTDPIKPLKDFLLTKRGKQIYGLTDDKELSEAERGWDALLDEFGFGHLDEFDLELMNGIHRGFFDEDALVSWAKRLDEKFKGEDSEGSFRAAWDIYHNSFDDNERQVVDEICAAFQQSVQTVSPMNLNGTVGLLKDLGRPQEAAELLRHYMEKRNEVRSFFDLSNYAFGGEVTDPEIRAAFDAKYKSFQDSRIPADILLNIAKNDSWSHADLSLLAGLSVEDFYNLFKEQRGSDLPRLVRASLSFARIVNADDDMRAIATSAKAALIRIGNESRINKRRVQKFGVKVE